ncbi:MAG TPA: helix-turn-helix domain-containing protein [Actinocrinis sp.]|uniref:helix-turn-helix domain-containing protein n=1 Tax=Actinocrinis sp. TaxID=1920516 RepID=UPI002D404A08|nr:helix-turn-helix domain-containing protein [Actinocrinis sp.]HZU54437.1 helix-turn-helix domain-containing protein [Actinocrinis sp.]
MIKQERAERTREAIIRAAAAVFERDGFTAAPLGEITRLATVTKGALYFHFASKRDLALAVVNEAADTVHWLLEHARRRQTAELPLQILIDLSHALVGRLADDQVLRAGLRLGTDEDLHPGRVGLSLDWAGVVDEVLRRPGAADAASPSPDLGTLPAQRPPSDSAAAERPSLGKDPLACVLTGLELLFRRSPKLVGQETLTSVWRLLLPGLIDSGEAERYEPSGTGSG